MPRMAPLPTVTVQAPADAQINVAPLELEKFAVPPDHEYEPDANVSVAPSDALLSAELTCESVVPAVQLQVVPLPLQSASAPEVHKSKTNTTIPNLCMGLSL
jgi:hypothetical protein